MEPRARWSTFATIALVEVGAETWTTPAAGADGELVRCGVFQLPGTNALDVADAVRQADEGARADFPPWLKYEIGYDTTPFIRESIADVIRTLFEAIVLVGLVVLVFLQDWRAMILPMIDVPVSLVGTFAVMALLGYSLNNISLFGLVLAIGIVVDDAIVVLENIERQMAMGLDARTATIKAMEEITGPILAITLVLCAVFVPCAFIPGHHGALLPAIRRDDLRVDDHLGRQRHDHDAVAGRGDLQGRGARREAARGEINIDAEVLPWWSFGIARRSAHLCGLAARRVLAGRIAGAYQLLVVPEWTASTVPTWLYWTLTVLHALPGIVVGLLVGWFAMRPSNAILGWLCAASIAPLTDSPRSTPGRSAWRCAERAGVAGLPRPGRGDVLGVYRGSHRLHPRDGPGPADRQPPVARCGGSRAHQRRHGQGGQDHPRQPRRGPHDHQRGSGGGGIASNWASMFVILKPFEERSGPDGAPRRSSTSSRAPGIKQIPEAKVTVNGAADPGPQPVRGLQADRRRPWWAWPESLAATDRNADGGTGPAARPE